MKRTLLPLIGLFSLATVLMMWPSYQLLVKPRQQSFDLFWIWAGGRAILAGENPYGAETTQFIQINVFHQIIPPDKYQHAFPHPAHIAFVLLPFIALPFSWSILLWTSLQIPLLLVNVLLGLDLLKWKPHPLTLFGLLLLVTLGFRYPIIIYVNGQLTLFVIFCLLMSVWFFRSHHVRAAAFALACTTIRPDLATVAILLVLFFIRRSPKRQEFITTLIEIGVIFFLMPMPFLGLTWPLIWIEALQQYGHNPNATYPPDLLPWWQLRGVLLISLAVWVGYHFREAWRNPTFFNYTRLVSAIIPTILMSTFQTGSYNLTFLLIPSFFLLAKSKFYWLRWLIAVSFLMPWFYFALGESFDRLIFLFMPAQFIALQGVGIRD